MEKLDEKQINDLADLFKVFGDFTRIRILLALYDKEMMVNEICEQLQMSQSAISHQLRNLKNSKLVKYRRDGKAILYSLDDDHIFKIIQQGVRHIKE